MDTGINRHGHLHIYNTLTRQKERFETIEPGKVGMYVCGVTVYDHAHIGHGMGSIVFDTIRRYLMHLGYDVRYAQNFTDIDDKIIDRASGRTSTRSPSPSNSSPSGRGKSML